MAIARQALTLLAAAVLLLLSSCNLEKEVSIELPSYLSEPVVECYLEPGKPYRLLLTRAYGYFETLDLGNPAAALINDATVIIRYDDREILLANGLYIDPAGRKVFNYGSEELVPEEAGREFSLEIVLADGNRLEATARMMPRVPLDSIVVQYNADSLARVLTYFTDDLNITNFYRRMLHLGSLDSTLQDFPVRDDFFDTGKAVFGSGFNFERGDTLINTLAHIDRPYFEYYNTLNQSIAANLNPFGQPGTLESNISGTRSAHGIFTGLIYDRDTVVIGQ